MNMLVVMDKGAVDDVEALRSQLTDGAYTVQVSPGFAFEIKWIPEDGKVNVLCERGAIDDIEKARAELGKPVGIVQINRGRRFEILA